MSSAFKVCRRFAQELFKKIGSDTSFLITDLSAQNDKEKHSNKSCSTRGHEQVLAQNIESATQYVQDLILDSYAYFMLGIPPYYLVVLPSIKQETHDILKSRFIHLGSRLATFNLTYADQIKLFGSFYEGILNYYLEYSAQGLNVIKNDQRRRLGAHYTPARLSAMMNQRVISLFIEKQSTPPNSELLLSLKVCDPSAGAGGILLDYAVQISQLITSYQKAESEIAGNQGKQSQQQSSPSSPSSTLSVPTLVVRRCLYAHDLDESALRVCRLSLLALAHGTQLKSHSLPLLFESIHHYKQLDHQDTARLQYLVPNETWTILHRHVICHNALLELKTWHDLHPEVFNDERHGFDLVIGNPPYISMYGRGSQARHFESSFLEQVQKNYGKIDDYSVLSGRLNLFLSFMVLSTKILTQDQSLSSFVGLILPDTMITNEAYTTMREGLCLTRRLIEVQRHDVDLFKGANVGISVVIWGDKSQKKSLGSSDQDDQQNIQQVTLRDQSNQRETVLTESHQALLKRNNCSWWPCASDDLDKAQMNIVESVLLSDVADIKDGFNTGSASRRQSLLIRQSTLKDTPKNARLCLEGKWITAFKIQKQALWIKNTGLEHLSTAKRFNHKKIIYRQTAPHIIAAVDLQGLVYLNSAHAIILYQHPEECLFALCAYLNSDLFRQRYRLLSGETRRTFPQVHVSTIKQVRVPKLIFEPKHPHCIELTRLAKSLSKLNDEVRSRSLLADLNELVSQIHKALFS